MATIYSPTSVCNAALTRIDVAQITSLSEDSKQAVWCNANYELLRDAFLADHPWNFAIARYTCPVDSTATPNHEFDRYFGLPDDFLFLVRTGAEADDLEIDYRIEGRLIASSEDSLQIEYVRRVEDLNQWHPLAIDAFVQRISAEATIPLVGSATQAENMWRVYDVKLSAARTVDSQMGRPRVTLPNDWINARAQGW